MPRLALAFVLGTLLVFTIGLAACLDEGVSVETAKRKAMEYLHETCPAATRSTYFSMTVGEWQGPYECFNVVVSWKTSGGRYNLMEICLYEDGSVGRGLFSIPKSGVECH